MDLSALRFTVNTEQLKSAINDMNALKTAVEQLGAVQNKLASNAEKVNRKVKETADAQEKAASTTKKAAKATEEVSEGASKSATILEKQTRTLSIFRGETQRAADGMIKLGDSFTKSQAGMLAIMQIAGGTTSELQQLAKVFTDYNKITGLNTFDKSAQALSKLKKEIEEMQAVTRLQAQGVALTRDEYVGLTRDIERLTQAMQAEGASTEQITKSVQLLNKEFVEQSLLRNKLLADAQSQERVAKETANRMVREATMMDQAVIKYRENELKKTAELQKRLQAETTMMDQAVIAFRKSEEEKRKAIQKTTDSIEMQIRRAEIAQKYVNEGFTIGQANRGARLETSGVSEDNTRQILAQDKANREAARSAREHANAIQFLADEERKVNAILDEVNGDINRQQAASERTATKVAAYGRALELSGIDAKKAAAMMETYRQKLVQIEKIETQRRSEILSRALAPQISDVVVSLGSGQNPLTVLLQQGLQVRDLIGQSGVEVQDLQRTFKTAAADMVSSLKGTAVAIGSLMLGVITDLGKAVYSIPRDMAKGLLASIKFSFKDLTGATEDIENITKAKEAMRLAALSLGKALMGLGLVMTTLLAVGLYQVIKQENELAKALTLSGGSMGISQVTAIKYAESMESVGLSTSEAMKAITAMAKEGGFLRGEIEMVTKAATEMEIYAGVAVEDTVKAFAKMKKEPVEALIELAKKTGEVNVETIRTVDSLVRQGNTAKASAIAMQELANVNSSQVTRMKEDYNSFSLAVIEMGRGIKKFFDDVFRDLFRKDAPLLALEKQLEAVKEIRSGEGLLNFNGGFLGQGKYYAELEQSLTEQIKLLKRASASEEERRAANVKAASDQQKALELIDQYTTKEIRKKNALMELEKRKASMTKEQYEMVRKGIEDQFKETATPRTPAENFFDTAMRKFVDNSVEARFAADELTKSQIEILKIVEDPRWLKLTEDQKRLVLEKFKEVYASEEIARTMNEELKLRQAVSDHSKKMMAEQFEAQQKTNLELFKQNESLREEIKMVGLSEEQIRALNEAKAEQLILEKELEIVNLKNVEGNEALIILREAELNMMREQLKLKGELAKAIEFDRFTKSLADAVETGLFEGGKAGRKKLRDLIVAELRKPITIFIQASIKSLFSAGLAGFDSFFGGGGDSPASGGTTSAAGIGGIASMISGASAAFNFLSGGLNSSMQVGKFVAQNLSRVASLGSEVLTNMVGEFAGGMLSTASMSSAQAALAGTGAQIGGLIVGSVMNGLSGYGISRAISGGYSTGGNTVNTLAAIASMIPGVGPVAGVVGGLVNRAFGRKAPVTTGTGIEGTFSTTGASVNQYTETFQKGGWFRSDKRRRYTSSVSSEFDRFLDESLMAITRTTKAFASILGLIPEAVDGVTQSINISLLGLNEQQQQEAIQRALGGFGDRLAQNLLGTFETVTTRVRKSFVEIIAAGMFNEGDTPIDPYKTVTSQVWRAGEFVREGETAGQALTRLATSLTTVNAAFDTLNQTLLASTLIGGDAASQLIDAFQGAETFTRLTTDYYQKFYTEQERTATTTRQLTTIFGNMGLTLPKTREEFRALVEAQDLYTESGRTTYAALLNLAPAFAQITDAVEQFTDALIDEVRRLRGEIGTQSGQNGLGYFTSQFTAANTAALAGDSNALAQLPELSQAVEEAARLNATSSIELVRIQAWLAQTLATTSAQLGQPVPAFASGGMHSGGVRLVGEQGPELEITGPSRIMNASQTASMLNGGVAEMIQVLNDNISGLRAEIRADVTYNAKVAKLLDRVAPEGDALTVTVQGTIDGGTF